MRRLLDTSESIHCSSGLPAAGTMYPPRIVPLSLTPFDSTVPFGRRTTFDRLRPFGRRRPFDRVTPFDKLTPLESTVPLDSTVPLLRLRPFDRAMPLLCASPAWMVPTSLSSAGAQPTSSSTTKAGTDHLHHLSIMKCPPL